MSQIMLCFSCARCCTNTELPLALQYQWSHAHIWVLWCLALNTRMQKPSDEKQTSQSGGRRGIQMKTISSRIMKNFRRGSNWTWNLLIQVYGFTNSSFSSIYSSYMPQFRLKTLELSCNNTAGISELQSQKYSPGFQNILEVLSL